MPAREISDRPYQLHLRFRKPKNKSDLMKAFMLNSIIQLDCQRGHPVGRARMTIGLCSHLTRQRLITCVVSATKPPHSASKPPTSTARTVQTEAAIWCYECEGLGHFARECPTRRSKNHNPSHAPGKGNQNERSKRDWGMPSPATSYSQGFHL